MTKQSAACKARQYSDEMVCHECGLTWDVNDPEPPKCAIIQRSAPTTLTVPVGRQYLKAKQGE